MLNFVFFNDRPEAKAELIANVLRDWRESAEWLSDLCNSCHKDKLPTIVLAYLEQNLIGYYALLASEYLTKAVSYTPWLSALLVFAPYRKCGHSPLMIQHACATTLALGFAEIYLTTSHIQYYEKFGFKEIGLGILQWGEPTKLYCKNLTSLMEISNEEK